MQKNAFPRFFLSLLKLDITYFTKSSLWATLQQIIGVTCGLIVSYFFGHFLSKTTFGEYNLILSYLGMLTFLSLPGLDLALTQSVSKKFDGSLIFAINSKFKFSLFGIPILLAISGYHFLQQQNQISTGLLIAALLFPFLNPFSIYPAFLTGKRNFSVLSIVSSLASLVLLSVSIFYFPKTPLLIFSYMMALIIPAIIGFYYCLRLVKNNTQDKELFRYGSFLTILSIIPWITGNLGSIILGNFINVEALAIYAVASKFLTSVQKNFQVFYKPITAKLASQSNKEHLNTLKTHWWKFFILGIFLSLFLFLLTPILINFFFGSKYQDAIVYGQVLSLALIPLPFSWVVYDMVMYQKRKKPQIIAGVLPQLVKIVLIFILIPRYQIWGLIIIILIERWTEPIVPFIALALSSHKKK